MVKRFGAFLAEHPLRRQLICMVNSNAVVNALGPTFMSQLVAERGAEPADVVRAFRIAREVTGADARWEVVERLESGTREAQLELMTGVDALVEATTRWYLTWEPEAEIEETIAAGRDGFERLAAAARRARLRRAQAPPRADRASGSSPPASPSRSRAPTRCAPSSATPRTWCGSRARPAARSRRSPRCSSPSAPSCAWTGSKASSSASRRPTRMQRWALQAVREDAAQVRRELAGTVLAEADGDVEAYLEDRSAALQRFMSFLRSLGREGDPDLAGLTLAVRQLRALAG